MIYLGIDLGGTKIEAAVIDSSGQVIGRHRTPTPKSYEDTLKAIDQLIHTTEDQLRQEKRLKPMTRLPLGIGVPGSISPRTGIMRNANATWLNGKKLNEDLENYLKRPVRLANDANCLALSEVVDGAAAGARSAFAIIIGSGCGGGMVVDGKLVEGANGIAGEWGHIPLPWAKDDEHPGPACWCGQKGCIETWVAGKGFERDYLAHTGVPLSAEAIIEASRSGSEAAVAAFERLLSRLGRALALLANTYDPDVFVFGGGLSNVHEIYDRLPEYILPYVFSDSWQAKLTPAKWGDSSGVRGAAWLWADQSRSESNVIKAMA